VLWRSFVRWINARDCESLMILASPFVKGGEQSEGAEGDFYKL